MRRTGRGRREGAMPDSGEVEHEEMCSNSARSRCQGNQLGPFSAHEFTELIQVLSMRMGMDLTPVGLARKRCEVVTIVRRLRDAGLEMLRRKIQVRGYEEKNLLPHGSDMR